VSFVRLRVAFGNISFEPDSSCGNFEFETKQIGASGVTHVDMRPLHIIMNV
jgi:hypothetical protein